MGHSKFVFFIDLSRSLKIVIYFSDNLLIFKFPNSKFDFKENLVNNLKTRMLAHF